MVQQPTLWHPREGVGGRVTSGGLLEGLGLELYLSIGIYQLGSIYWDISRYSGMCMNISPNI
jgi:hypothetical protein